MSELLYYKNSNGLRLFYVYQWRETLNWSVMELPTRYESSGIGKRRRSVNPHQFANEPFEPTSSVFIKKCIVVKAKTKEEALNGIEN